MIITGNPKEQILSQIISFYGVTFENVEVSAKIEEVYDEVIGKIDNCFSHIKNKYYHGNGSEALFNPLHTAQWTMFLYYLANTLKLRSSFNTDLCDIWN